MPPNSESSVTKLPSYCTILKTIPDFHKFTYVFYSKRPLTRMKFSKQTRNANSIGVGKKVLSRYSEKVLGIPECYHFRML